MRFSYPVLVLTEVSAHGFALQYVVILCVCPATSILLIDLRIVVDFQFVQILLLLRWNDDFQDLYILDKKLEVYFF